MWKRLDTIKGVHPAGKFILWRDDSNKPEINTVKWDLVGNPNYAYSHYWSDTDIIFMGPYNEV